VIARAPVPRSWTMAHRPLYGIGDARASRPRSGEAEGSRSTAKPSYPPYDSSKPNPVNVHWRSPDKQSIPRAVFRIIEFGKC
jgi:hypothetical protein